MLLKPKSKFNDQNLKFAPMGQKPSVKADVENAADAKKPGDKKEDKADVKKTKKSGNYFAKKAATALAGGGKATGISVVAKKAKAK